MLTVYMPDSLFFNDEFWDSFLKSFTLTATPRLGRNGMWFMEVV